MSASATSNAPEPSERWLKAAPKTALHPRATAAATSGNADPRGTGPLGHAIETGAPRVPTRRALNADVRFGGDIGSRCAVLLRGAGVTVHDRLGSASRAPHEIAELAEQSRL